MLRTEWEQFRKCIEFKSVNDPPDKICCNNNASWAPCTRQASKENVQLSYSAHRHVQLSFQTWVFGQKMTFHVSQTRNVAMEQRLQTQVLRRRLRAGKKLDLPLHLLFQSSTRVHEISVQPNTKSRCATTLTRALLFSLLCRAKGSNLISTFTENTLPARGHRLLSDSLKFWTSKDRSNAGIFCWQRYVNIKTCTLSRGTASLCPHADARLEANGLVLN